MPLSVRLTAEEEALLEAASRRSARTKSQLVRQSVRELCLRLARPEKTPFEMGKGLFGVGTRSPEPKDPTTRAIKEKLRAKHGRLG